MRKHVLDWYSSLKSEILCAFWSFRAIRCQVTFKHSLTHLFAYDNTYRKKKDWVLHVCAIGNTPFRHRLFVLICIWGVWEEKKLFVTVWSYIHAQVFPRLYNYYITLTVRSGPFFFFFFYILVGSLQMLGILKMTAFSSSWHIIPEKKEIDKRLTDSISGAPASPLYHVLMHKWSLCIKWNWKGYLWMNKLPKQSTLF